MPCWSIVPRRRHREGAGAAAGRAALAGAARSRARRARARCAAPRSPTSGRRWRCSATEADAIAVRAPGARGPHAQGSGRPRARRRSRLCSSTAGDAADAGGAAGRRARARVCAARPSARSRRDARSIEQHRAVPATSSWICRTPSPRPAATIWRAGSPPCRRTCWMRAAIAQLIAELAQRHGLKMRWLDERRCASSAPTRFSRSPRAMRTARRASRTCEYRPDGQSERAARRTSRSSARASCSTPAAPI